jgi:hypothetical protein
MEPKKPFLDELEEDYVQLTNSGNEMVDPRSKLAGKVIGFYFTSQSCVPCR